MTSKLRILMILVAAASLSGCSLEDMVVSDEFGLLWALVPLVGIGGIATPIFIWYRSKQFRYWDIATSPSVPSAMRLFWWVAISAAVLWIAFLGYNLYVPDMDPKQIAINAVSWAVGSALGVAATDRLGRRFSNPKH
jgi:hypothetical protein